MSAERIAVGQALAETRTEFGVPLLDLTEASPVLLVFLRHFGCPFCRLAISRVSEAKDELEARGVRPVFVHLGTPKIAQAHFEYYGMKDVERVHDPEAALYQHAAFGLGKKHWFLEGMKPAVAWKWVRHGFRHGVGTVQNDGNQMPGIFFLRGPEIVRRFVHKTIADEPDYLALTR